MSPIVSVVIHSYNRFDYLQNALKSVHEQTLQDFEIILVNDESTDERYYKNTFGNKVKQIDIRRNKNPRWTGSRQALINVGLEEASGKYIALLDDDDIWMKNKLETQIGVMEDNYFQFSSTEGFYGLGEFNPEEKYKLYNAEYFNKVLRKKYRWTKYLKNGKLPKIWNEEFLNVHNCCIASTVMIHKDIVDKIGNFSNNNWAPDWEYWKRVIKHTDCVYVDEPLLHWDSGSGDGKLY